MNYCVFTFIDNQDIIKYPVDLIFKNFDCERFLFGTKKSLNFFKCNTINIEQSIKTPQDIATAQNLCLEWLEKNTDYDFFIHPQADIYLDKKQTDKLISELDALDIKGIYGIEIERIRLYYICRLMNFGFSIIGSQSGARYANDGANFSQKKQLLNDIRAVDVGYFGMQNYRNHAKNHSGIWTNRPSDFSFWDKNESEFIGFVKDKAIKREGSLGKIIDPPKYKELFDYFNLHNEFINIQALL